MKRIGMTVAALCMAGGVLLAPSVGQACEAHGHAAKGQASTPPAKKDGDTQARPAQNPLKEVDELLTAKCQCDSKADCTCKKGQCECSKCKGGKRQVMDALRKQAPALKLEDARYDASAGVFI
ncbi:metallothionein [Hyalangium gracile]|uniref:metallothionein n=1 Tax=Hyalangium gracile TaxID=394092 RepID=UPI001CCD9932|nr:metallothionein [Hyalangium gracile]